MVAIGQRPRSAQLRWWHQHTIVAKPETLASGGPENGLSASVWGACVIDIRPRGDADRAAIHRALIGRQKNKAADAEATAVVARQPEMRFVELETLDRQAKAVLFQARDRGVRLCTEPINALRSALYEFVHTVSQAFAQWREYSIGSVLRPPTKFVFTQSGSPASFTSLIAGRISRKKICSSRRAK